MNYKAVVNTAVKYFEKLGNWLAIERRNQSDHMAYPVNLNKWMKKWELTQGGLSAHIWVTDSLNANLELHKWMMKEYGGWNNPTGKMLQEDFKRISLKGYLDYRYRVSIGQAEKRWQAKLATAKENGNEDDIIFINRKLQVYAMVFAYRDVTVAEIMAYDWIDGYLDGICGVYNPNGLSEEYR